MLEIRSVGEGDFEPLCTVLQELHGEALYDDESRAEIERVFHGIRASESRYVWIAWVQDRPVGTIDLTIVQNLTRNASPWSVVENFVVIAEARRQGVGRALLERAVAAAGDHGCYKVQLVSGDTRDAAHLAYVALGFDAPVRGFRRYLRTTTPHA